jgi:hypothetical protein
LVGNCRNAREHRFKELNWIEIYVAEFEAEIRKAERATAYISTYICIMRCMYILFNPISTYCILTLLLTQKSKKATKEKDREYVPNLTLACLRSECTYIDVVPFENVRSLL